MGSAELADRSDRNRVLPVLRAGDRDGLPSLLHPWVLQVDQGIQDRARGGGLDGDRGPDPGLGLRPPQAPQVQRQGGRSALALALRRRLEGATKGMAWAHMGWLF